MVPAGCPSWLNKPEGQQSPGNGFQYTHTWRAPPFCPFGADIARHCANFSTAPRLACAAFKRERGSAACRFLPATMGGPSHALSPFPPPSVAVSSRPDRTALPPKASYTTRGSISNKFQYRSPVKGEGSSWVVNQPLSAARRSGRQRGVAKCACFMTGTNTTKAAFPLWRGRGHRNRPRAVEKLTRKRKNNAQVDCPLCGVVLVPSPSFVVKGDAGNCGSRRFPHLPLLFDERKQS